MMTCVKNVCCCWFLLVFVSTMTGVQSLNILGLATYDGNSHWFVMKSVFEALSNAGHQVTVITPYSVPQKNNFTVIDISKTLPPRTNSFRYETLLAEYHRPLTTLHVLPNLSLEQCDKAHALAEVRQFINGRTKFDLVITEVFGADCDAVFATLLKVPLISVIASTYLPWASARVGNPENPSYVSHILLPYTDTMTFPQRLVNSMFHLYSSLLTIYYDMKTTAMNRKHFGDNIPSIGKIMQNTSLIFVNSHFSVDVARPYVPNVVEIGGIHLPPLKPLPKDIADLLDNSKKGVIYFSLGSIVKASSLPNETISAIKSTFAEMADYVILWKFEDETLDVSSNVHISKWFPQRDIFAHPKVKLAITHGGLMTIYEAVDQGVPILGIPLFFDQHRNVMNLVSKQVALRIEIDKITKDVFKEKVRRLLEDKRFKKKALQLSKIFHDRAMSPADSVVYWTEYVARHNGAKHMRCAAADTSQYKLLLLDVFAFLILLFLVSIYLIVRILMFTSNLLSHSHKNILHKNRTHLKAS